VVSLFFVGHVVYEHTRLDSFAIALHNIINNHSKSAFDLHRKAVVVLQQVAVLQDEIGLIHSSLR
jgi:hypothetical protein